VIEHHLGELFPRAGFIVTPLTGMNRAVARFYNQRRTAEQWIKEGKEATHWMRLTPLRSAQRSYVRPCDPEGARNVDFLPSRGHAAYAGLARDAPGGVASAARLVVAFMPESRY